MLHFRVDKRKYDGPALATHTINARDLGTALLAISDLCQGANRVLTGEDAKVEVRVEVTGEGCYEIVFKLIQYVEAVAPLFLEAGRLTAKEILELLGLYASPSVVGLLNFSKWRKGRPIIKEETVISRNDSGDINVQVTVLGDNNKIDSIIIDKRVNHLDHDYPVREAQKDLLSPLRANVITNFSSRGEDNPVPVEVTDSEVAEGYFKTEEFDLTETPVPDIETSLTLRAPVFKRGAKWQFLFEGQFIYALILDEKFNDKVFEKGERFGADNRFRVKLRIKQSLSNKGKIQNNYEIIEVIEEILGPESPELPLSTTNDIKKI